MKNSADTDVARLHNSNFWDGDILIRTPCRDPVYIQHPNSCHFELLSQAHIFPNNTSLSQGALMKSTSLSERVWKNNGGTEIITLHSALGFNTFLIKASKAGWITTVISDAVLIKASRAATEKTLHFIIVFAWDMARGKRCRESVLTCRLPAHFCFAHLYVRGGCKVAALQVPVLIWEAATLGIGGGSKAGDGGRVWLHPEHVQQWAQTKWPWPALGRSIWERLTPGFNERNDQSHDHLCWLERQRYATKGSWLNLIHGYIGEYIEGG